VIQGLREFGDRLDQLRASLEDVEATNRLAALDLTELDDGPVARLVREHAEPLKANAGARRVYSYASCMMLLYGAFEQFVETLLMEYLEELNRLVPEFGQLPDAVKANHSEASAHLLLNLGLDKYRNRTSADEVAQRLASCAGGGPYVLNVLAYVNHSANLRIETVGGLFKDVGISGIGKLVRASTAFQPYLRATFPDGGIEQFRDWVVFHDLTDLVDRRNVIAHGWPDDLLSSTLMEERIEFVRALGASFHEVLTDELRPYVFEHSSQALPGAIEVFNHEIVCFRLEDAELAVGDRILARCPDGRLSEGPILSLQVEHAAVEFVKAPPAVNVGCRVGFRAKKGYTYAVVR